MHDDPNGISLPDWQRYGYESYESWIESKAGASLPEPMSPSGEARCDSRKREGKKSWRCDRANGHRGLHMSYGGGRRWHPWESVVASCGSTRNEPA